MSISDFEEMELKEIEWTYSRLIKQRRDEKELEKKKKNEQSLSTQQF